MSVTIILLPYNGKLKIFCGVQFCGWSIFTISRVNLRAHAHYALYKRAFLTGFIFAVRRSSAKTVKIGPLENFPLYGIIFMHRSIIHSILYM